MQRLVAFGIIGTIVIIIIAALAFAFIQSRRRRDREVPHEELASEVQAVSAVKTKSKS